MKLYLLGPPRVELQDRPIEMERRKEVALLAYLAVTEEAQSRDMLAAIFWPNNSQNRARADLSRDLSILNKALKGCWLEIERERVGLRREAGFWLDVEQFQRLAHSTTGPASRLETLTEAVNLYRDDFLTGFTLPDCPDFDEWQFFQTEGLRQSLASVTEQLIDLHRAQGDYDAAIVYARRRLSLDLLHEPAHRSLMRLYAATGQQAAALRQYQRCVQVFEEELNVPPADETTVLFERIRSGDQLANEGEASPRLSHFSTFRHNMPAQTTPFLGREWELAALGQLLTEPELRLVTILGIGGMGKTRLALKAAAELVPKVGCGPFPDGIYLVRLAALDSPESVLPAVAEALDLTFREGDDPRNQLFDFLRSKTMLLLLDNFERLLAETDLVLAMLAAAPGLKILVTSRSRLNVQGEQLFRISGIDFPEQEMADPETANQYSAVELFVQSARRMRPDFALTTNNVMDVVHLCRLVQGMPLGIILAAAWVEVFSPAEIAVELFADLGFLETELRDVPERQRNMRAVFDRSWRLLSAQEQILFRRLSVFRGGFTRSAAQAVSRASARPLRALINKSFLHTARSGRFDIHELLRQYGAEALDQFPTEGHQLHEQHSTYYLALLQHRECRLKGSGQSAALAEIKTEWENVRAAWQWAVQQGERNRLSSATDSLGLYCEWSGRYQEGEALFSSAVERLTPGQATSAIVAGKWMRLASKLLTWQAVFTHLLGDVESAERLFDRSLSILEQSPTLQEEDVRAEKAFLLCRLGFLMINREGPVEAKTVLEQSLTLYQSINDRWGMARTLDFLGGQYHFLEDHEQARSLLTQGLALYQAISDERGVSSVSQTLAFEALALGQQDDGHRLLRKSVEIQRRLGNPQGLAEALSCRGQGCEYTGRFAEALPFLHEALAINEHIGFRLEIAFLTLHLSRSELHLGEYKEARRHAQASLDFFQEIGDAMAIPQALWMLGMLALASEQFDSAQRYLLQSADFLQGAALGLWLGEVQVGLVYAARGLDDLRLAQQHLLEAQRTALQSQNHRLFLTVLPPSALLLADRGRAERALALYALASREAYVANSRWFEKMAGRPMATVAAALPPDTVAAAQARGQTRALEPTVTELLAEFESQAEVSGT